ncbi:hypothetical protein [Streptomyces sp. NPDC005476]|uniref:hypothetical protein n=1 Tax=Streptomyces sp. NPDC005476 TaxID=3156882 RepID=UPI0034516AC2
MSDAAYQALFEQLDVPLVADYDELASVLQCLTVPDLPPAAGTWAPEFGMLGVTESPLTGITSNP